jgi:histidine triad (HIT) family protein
MKETKIDSECLFCQIIAGQIPSQKVFENPNFLAIRDINPKAKLHILLIPKAHTADLLEFAAATPELLIEVPALAEQISQELSNGEFRLLFNQGASAGQEIFHTHAHILSDITSDQE